VVVQAVVLGSANLLAPQVVARMRANLVSGPQKLASSPARPPARPAEPPARPAQPPAKAAGPPATHEDAASRPAIVDTNVPIMQS
jgi:hypothetical protein